MAQFTLEILKNGAWTAVPEGGTIQPSGGSDEIRLKFAHASTGFVMVTVRTEKGQEPFTAPSGSGELSLGTAGRYSAGKFAVYLSSRGGFTGEVIDYHMGTHGSGSASGGRDGFPGPRPGDRETPSGDDPVPGGATGRPFPLNPLGGGEKPVSSGPISGGGNGNAVNRTGTGKNPFLRDLSGNGGKPLTPASSAETTGNSGKPSAPASNAEMEKMKKDNAELMENAEKQEKKNAELQKKLDDLKERIAALEDLDTKNKDAEGIREAAKKAEEEKQQAEETVKKAEEEKKKAAEALAQAEEEKKQLKEKQEKLKGDLEDLTSAVADEQKKKDEARAELDRTKAELDRLKGAHMDAQKALEELEEKRKQAGMKDEEISQAESAIQEAEEKLKDLTAERDRLADDVAGLEETVQKQNAELEAIKSTLETKTADLEEARKQLDEVNAAAAKLDAEYRDKLEEIKPLLDSFFKDCGLITHRSERIDKDLMLVRTAAESEDFRKNMKDLHGFLKRLDSVEKEMKQIMKEYNEVIIITEK